MSKKTIYGSEARIKIMEGIDAISEAVVCTLGPKGRNVIIARHMIDSYNNIVNLPVKVSKDGYTVAQAFDTDDSMLKPGVMIVKEAAGRTVNEAGDGTTTVTVLCRAIAKAGIEMIEKGANPVILKREIDEAVLYVVSELKKLSVPLKGNIDRIRQIATVSANNDPSIGDMIADAFKKIGDDGVIDIDKSASIETEIKIADGYKFNSGWISPLFVTKKEKQICEFENPIILLYEKRLTSYPQMQRALELVAQSGRPVLIICEDADQVGLGMLAMNHLQQRIQCCLVKSPAYGEARREEMEDIALLTGGFYLSDSRGVGIQEMEFVHFGQAKKVTITKDETIIIGGKGEKDEINDVIVELRMNLAQAKNEDERAPIEKRIARLIGGIAVIHVGAASEMEQHEKMDRFDDSVRATKAAIIEGYVPGGGTAFIRIQKEWSLPKTNGGDLIKSVLSAPLIQICKNAGVDSELIYDQVLGSGDGFGYNAKDDVIENLITSGIIDPVKVLRCAIQNAASAAGTIITSEAMIVDTM